MGLYCGSILRAHVSGLCCVGLCYARRGMSAIILINPNALSRADKVDVAPANGAVLPDLFCAPIVVKDNVDTSGMSTSGGCEHGCGGARPWECKLRAGITFGTVWHWFYPGANES
jgi:hypothetical protein